MQNLISVPYTLLSEKSRVRVRTVQVGLGSRARRNGSTSTQLPCGSWTVQNRDTRLCRGSARKGGHVPQLLRRPAFPVTNSLVFLPLRIRNCDVRNGAAQFQLYVECVVEYVMYVLYECLYTSKTRTMYLVKHEACASSLFALERIHQFNSTMSTWDHQRSSS